MNCIIGSYTIFFIEKTMILKPVRCSNKTRWCENVSGNLVLFDLWHPIYRPFGSGGLFLVFCNHALCILEEEKEDILSYCMALPVGLFVYSFGFYSSDPWAFGLCVDMARLK